MLLSLVFIQFYPNTMYSILLSGILLVILLGWTMQREKAIRAAKEVKKTTGGEATTKKAPAAGAAKAVPKALKVNMKAAPKVGGYGSFSLGLTPLLGDRRGFMPRPQLKTEGPLTQSAALIVKNFKKC